MADPIELGARAAQLRCLSSLRDFHVDDSTVENTVKMLKGVTKRDVSDHSVELFAEIAAVSVFSRRHYKDEPPTEAQLNRLLDHLVEILNSFTHYG